MTDTATQSIQKPPFRFHLARFATRLPTTGGPAGTVSTAARATAGGNAQGERREVFVDALATLPLF